MRPEHEELALRDHGACGLARGYLRAVLSVLLVALALVPATSGLAAAGQFVPMLCYHDLSRHPVNDMMNTPANFEAQMKWLKETGYHTLTMDQLVGFMSKGEHIPPRSIVLTFDDGYEGVYRYAYPILKQNHMHAVLFLVTGMVGSTGGDMQHLTWKQVAAMDHSGVVEAEVHCGLMHEDLAKRWQDERRHGKPHTDIEHDLSVAKETLERRLHKKVRYLAWPYGDYTRSLVTLAQRMGYVGFVTTAYGVNHHGDSTLRIKRLRMSSRYDTLARFRRKLAAYTR